MSDQDGAPMNPALLRGYSSPLDVSPGSSSEPGVVPGSPPGGESPPRELADGSSPDKMIPYSRLEQVVRQKEELERRLQAFEGLTQDTEWMASQVARFGESGRARGEAPAAEPARTRREELPDPNDDDEVSAWFEKRLKTAIGPDLEEMRNYVQSQKQVLARQQAETELTQLERRYPDFDRNRDGPVLLRTMQQYPGLRLGDAYRIAYFDRIASTSRQPAPTAGAHDIGGAVPTTGSQDRTELLKRLQSTEDPHQREIVGEAIVDDFMRRTGLDKLFS